MEATVVYEHAKIDIGYRNNFMGYVVSCRFMNIKTIHIGTTLALITLMLGLGAGLPSTVHALATTNQPESSSLKGALTSIQSDPVDNNTSWIVSGVFRMDNMSETTAGGGSSPTFNSSFYMVKTDGTALHTHDVYDLQLTGQPSMSGNSTIFNGTATVTMREGPVEDVPISINLMDDSAVSIWFDPTQVQNHFGDSPIYGTQHLICVESPEYCK